MEWVGQGTGDRGQGTGDRGQGTGDRGQGTGDRNYLADTNLGLFDRVTIVEFSIAMIDVSFLVLSSIISFERSLFDFRYQPLLSRAEPLAILKKCGYSFPNPRP